MLKQLQNMSNYVIMKIKILKGQVCPYEIN